jgi:hypothetical protein
LDIQQGMQRGAAFVQSLHNLIPSIGAMLESKVPRRGRVSLSKRSRCWCAEHRYWPAQPAAFADTLRPIVVQLVQTVVDGCQVAPPPSPTPTP